MQAFEQLVELRDVLEMLFKAAATNDPRSLGTGLSVDAVNGLLSRCKNEISEIETALKQEIDRTRIKGSLSSFNPQVIPSGFASTITALRGVVAENQRYVYIFSKKSNADKVHKGPHWNQCWKFSGLYQQ